MECNEEGHLEHDLQEHVEHDVQEHVEHDVQEHVEHDVQEHVEHDVQEHVEHNVQEHVEHDVRERKDHEHDVQGHNRLNQQEYPKPKSVQVVFEKRPETNDDFKCEFCGNNIDAFQASEHKTVIRMTNGEILECGCPDLMKRFNLLERASDAFWKRLTHFLKLGTMSLQCVADEDRKIINTNNTEKKSKCLTGEASTSLTAGSGVSCYDNHGEAKYFAFDNGIIWDYLCYLLDLSEPNSSLKNVLLDSIIDFHNKHHGKEYKISKYDSQKMPRPFVLSCKFHTNDEIVSIPYKQTSFTIGRQGGKVDLKCESKTQKLNELMSRNQLYTSLVVLDSANSVNSVNSVDNSQTKNNYALLIYSCCGMHNNYKNYKPMFFSIIKPGETFGFQFGTLDDLTISFDDEFSSFDFKRLYQNSNPTQSIVLDRYMHTAWQRENVEILTCLQPFVKDLINHSEKISSLTSSQYGELTSKYAYGEFLDECIKKTQ